MKEIILENTFFFLGIIVAEILSPPKDRSFTEELAFIFFVVAVGSVVFQKEYLLFGNEYYFSFFIGLVSTYISNLIISSYIFLSKEIKHSQRKLLLQKVKDVKERLKKELELLGWDSRKVDKLIRKVF